MYYKNEIEKESIIKEIDIKIVRIIILMTQLKLTILIVRIFY